MRKQHTNRNVVKVAAVCVAIFAHCHETRGQTQMTGTAPCSEGVNCKPLTVSAQLQPKVQDATSRAGVISPTVAASSTQRSFFSFSLAAGAGYDTAVNSDPSNSAPTYTSEGWVQAKVNRRKYRLLAEHDARIARIMGKAPSTEQFQQTALTASGDASRLTTWTARFDNGYGSDDARLFGGGSLQDTAPAAIDQLPSTAIVTTANTLSDSLTFGIQHRHSREVTYEVSAKADYRHFYDLVASAQQQSVAATARRSVSPILEVGVEVTGVHETFATSTCSSISGLAVARLELPSSLRLDFRGGPSVTSAGCSGSYSAEVQLFRPVGYHRFIYIGAARKPSSQYAAGANWETSAFGGLVFGQARGIRGRSSAGYSDYQVAQQAGSTPSLHGYFFSQELSHRLAGTAELALTARYMNQASGQTNLNRSIVFLTFVWSREQRTRHTEITRGLHGD